jgi:hypothetical protein
MDVLCDSPLKGDFSPAQDGNFAIKEQEAKKNLRLFERPVVRTKKESALRRTLTVS